MAGPSIDDLLRAADKGQAVGTTQRYFKTEPKGSASPAPPASAPEPLLKPGETEKEMMDRLLGRSKTSMSDIDEPERVGAQYASAGRVTPETAVSAAPKTDRGATLKAVREKYPMYADMPDNELAIALAAKFPAYADLVEPAKKAEDKKAPASFLELMAKNVAKIPERAKGEVASAVETLKNPSLAATLPLVVPGAGVPMRIATAALGRGLDTPGGLEDKAKGAVKGGALATLAEGIFGAASRLPIPKVMPSLKTMAEGLKGERETVLERNAERIVEAGRKTTERAARAAEKTAEREARVVAKTEERATKAAEKTAERERGYEFATNAPKDAMDFVLPRTPEGAKVLIPSLGPERVALKDAAAALAKKHGPEYEQALAEIVNTLNLIDKQRLAGAVAPWAGDLFKSRVAAARFPPRAVSPKPVPAAVPAAPRPVNAPRLEAMPSGSTMERFAEERALPFLESSPVRQAADLAANRLPEQGEMAAAGAGLGLLEGTGSLLGLAKHLMMR